MKLRLALIAFALLIVGTLSAHAQGGTVTSGCGTSPENPTIILGFVGSASGLLVAARNRYRRRSK